MSARGWVFTLCFLGCLCFWAWVISTLLGVTAALR